MATSVVVAFAGIAAWGSFIRRQTRRVRTQPRACGRTLVGLTGEYKEANLVLVVALVVSSGMVAATAKSYSIFLSDCHF